MHGLWVGMNSEKGCPQQNDALDAVRNRVANVVELHVDEDLLAGVGERAREIKPAGEGELIADLVEADGIGKPRHHRLRLGDGRKIERDDQAFAGLKHRLISPPAGAYARIRSISSPPA